MRLEQLIASLETLRDAHGPRLDVRVMSQDGDQGVVTDTTLDPDFRTIWVISAR